MDISNISSQAGIDGLISQYMAIERQPMYKLELDKSEVNVKLGIYKDLKSKLKSLRDMANDFAQTGSLSEFGSRSITSGNEDLVTTSSNGNATNGSHLLKILQLAKADTVVTNRFTGSGNDILNSEGTGSRNFTITVAGEEHTISVDIADGDDNAAVLSKVVSAINSSDSAVNASIVNDSSSTQKLVLRSDETGSTNGISLADTSGGLLSTIGLVDGVAATETSGGYMYADSALDSKIELDGIAITNASNVLEDILPGVTLTLKGTQEASAEAVQINIGADKTAIKENLESFFEKYNEVVDYIKAKMAVDPDTSTRGPLSGDFAFINLRMNLRTLVSGEVSGLDADNPSRITEVGIEPDDSGRLRIADTEAFEEALEANVSKVSDLFNSESGLAQQIYDLLTPFTQTGGTLDDKRDGLDAKIDTIDSRIEGMEKRLEWKENNYRTQFLKLQEAMDSLTGQQSMLSMMNASLFSS